VNDIVNSILLGIVEGLTEFLPVSSTGHLLVTEHFLKLPGERWDAFTVVIQLGAILAVVVVYWQKFWQALIGLPTSADARRFAFGVILAFLPAAVAGVAFGKYINALLLDPARAMPFIAASWIAGGIIILILERLAPKPRFREGDKLPLSKAFQIGLCQVFALIPGTSRSGATILGGELLGVERSAAAAFTFYLAVPTMLGATVYELYKKGSAITQHDETNIAIGFAVSFVVAYFVIRAFLAIIGRYGLKPFGWYRIAAGLALMGALVLGW
jgi:undecaprenyl-diphosphatase